MKKIFKEFNKQDLMSILAILIGSVWAISNPEESDSIFNKTILVVILIKIFWK